MIDKKQRPTMAHQKLEANYTFTEEKLQALKQIVPEAFEDGKVNFETLRECLGDWVEDGEDERFGLTWPGKRDARRLAAIPSKGTLVPVYGDGLKADGTPDEDGHNDSRNVFIEGENLEVLKTLHKSYAGRIKMIYIDPPYNTGNDFVYDDDFTEPLQHYLRRTGQIDDEGRALTTNKRADGRFHSKWLSMMYPRLKLARELLREDGVIFVSIDDNEVHNLRELMNEVFGEEGFVEQVCWKNKYGAGAKTKGFISVHEYILCYSKSPIEDLASPLSEESMRGYNKKDDKYDLRGPYFTQPLMTNSLGDRPNLQYSIFYEGVEIVPKKQWVWAQERLLEAIEKDEVVFNKKKDGSYSVRAKQYLRDENGTMRDGKPLSVMIGPYNQDGTKEIRQLFNGKSVFDFPKPVELIKYFLSFKINPPKVDSEEDIVLDFFSGSGPLGQAVYELNDASSLKLKFICVQIPEAIPDNHLAYKQGFRKIPELTRERFKKVSNKSTNHLKDKGFKSFRLQPGQLYQEWNGNVQELFQEKRNWNKDELLYELILTEGFPLDSTVRRDEAYQDNTVRRVQSEFHGHQLLICLDDQIAEATIQQLDLSGDAVFVCFDHAITDQEKLRLSDKGLIKTIG